MSDAPHDISRRALVRALVVAPVAGTAVLWGCTNVDRAAHHVRQLGTDDEHGTPYVPKFFTPHEWRTVAVLVDYLIPRDSRSGSATDAKVPEFMDFFLSDPDLAPGSDTLPLLIRGGLGWLDGESHKRFDAPFLDATDVHRRTILDDIAWPAKAHPDMRHGVAFFNTFRDLTASGFWSSEMGFHDLGYQGHVAVPEWTGCPEPVLQRLGVSYDLMQHRAKPV